MTVHGGVAQLGERLGQLYCLSHGGMYLTRQPRGSHPYVGYLNKAAILTEYGGVAQLGERTVRIRKVKGSNPSVSTNRGKSGFRLPFFHTAVCTVKF